MKGDAGAVLTATFLGLLIGLALAAPLIAFQDPHDLSQVYLADSEKPPLSRASAGFVMLLGADGLGRDMLSAILYGLRLSLFVAAASSGIAAALGTTLGLASAYVQGPLGAFVMRATDLHLAFPPLFLAMIVVFSLGKSVVSLIFALIAIQWAPYARVAYASALAELPKLYVEAARGLGLSRTRVMFRHVFPNCLPFLLTAFLTQLSRAVSLEATLSFLSVGLPQAEPSLGGLIAEGFEHLLSGAYWISFFPGLALAALLLGINALEDRLQTRGASQGPHA